MVRFLGFLALLLIFYDKPFRKFDTHLHSVFWFGLGLIVGGAIAKQVAIPKREKMRLHYRGR